MKIETVTTKLAGSEQRAVAIPLSAKRNGAMPPRAVMMWFLAAAGPIDALAARVASGR